MIKRSVPNTFLVKCPNLEYAEGVKDGIMFTLQSLLHECDIVMRKSPEIFPLAKEHEEHDQQYLVRSRFTARDKKLGKEKGEWIKTDKAYYEEEMVSNFEIGKEWVGLTDDEMLMIYAQPHEGFKYSLGRMIQAKLKEKNNG
jgi:hypothetical protein